MLEQLLYFIAGVIVGKCALIFFLFHQMRRPAYNDFLLKKADKLQKQAKKKDKTRRSKK